MHAVQVQTPLALCCPIRLGCMGQIQTQMGGDDWRIPFDVCPNKEHTLGVALHPVLFPLPGILCVQFLLHRLGARHIQGVWQPLHDQTGSGCSRALLYLLGRADSRAWVSLAASLRLVTLVA